MFATCIRDSPVRKQRDVRRICGIRLTGTFLLTVNIDDLSTPRKTRTTERKGETLLIADSPAMARLDCHVVSTGYLRISIDYRTILYGGLIHYSARVQGGSYCVPATMRSCDEETKSRVYYRASSRALLRFFLLRAPPFLFCRACARVLEPLAVSFSAVRNTFHS